MGSAKIRIKYIFLSIISIVFALSLYKGNSRKKKGKLATIACITKAINNRSMKLIPKLNQRRQKGKTLHAVTKTCLAFCVHQFYFHQQ